jgi:hypothetical protein
VGITPFQPQPAIGGSIQPIIPVGDQDQTINIQKPPTNPPGTPTMAQGTTETPSAIQDPLIQEAKKYKTAEEFVNSYKEDIRVIPANDNRFAYHVSENPNITELSPANSFGESPGKQRYTYFSNGEPSRTNGFVYAVDKSKLPADFFEKDPNQIGAIRTTKPIPQGAIIPLGEISVNSPFNKLSKFQTSLTDI